MMNVVQIDQALEKLMLELQGFKRSSDMLTAAGTKVEEVIVAAEAVVNLAEQIRKDNQRQVEAVQKYTATSEQNLAALVENATNAQIEQRETHATLQKNLLHEMETLAKSIDAVRKQQQDDVAKLSRVLSGLGQEQKRAQERQMWLLFVILFITMIGTGIALWMLVASTGSI